MIDINADLGEGTGNDAQIMPLIHSCNIACGGHFGDAQSMEQAMLLATRHQVKIGAHPSYPDHANFGRKVLDIAPAALTQSLLAQLQAFQAIAQKLALPIHHIKPHGAIYNHSAKDESTARALLKAIQQSQIQAKIVVPPRSILGKLAKPHYDLITEAFIDRRYEADLSLVSRAKPNAIIHDKTHAWAQLKAMHLDKQVQSIDNEWQTINAQTYCIHGDHENSVAILEYIHQKLAKL